jgi:hypothetical protein
MGKNLKQTLIFRLPSFIFVQLEPKKYILYLKKIKKFKDAVFYSQKMRYFNIR